MECLLSVLGSIMSEVSRRVLILILMECLLRVDVDKNVEFSTNVS